MESNDESKNEFCDLTEEEEQQEYLLDNRELSFEEFKNLSDEEQSKYLKANGIDDGTFEEFHESFKKDIEHFKETNDKMKKIEIRNNNAPLQTLPRHRRRVGVNIE